MLLQLGINHEIKTSPAKVHLTGLRFPPKNTQGLNEVYDAVSVIQK